MMEHSFAIRILKLMRGGIKMGLPYTQDPVEKEIEQEQLDALNYAIPFLETEPCEDCISRADALRVAKNEYHRGWHDAIGEALKEEHDIHSSLMKLGISKDSSLGKSVEDFMSTLPSVYPKSDTIPRERIDQMVAEIEKMQITSGVTGQGAWNECLHYVLETIREYTKEQNNE